MVIQPVELHFNKYGEGPPLLILHGLLGASGNWHSLSRGAFGEHFTVYALDLRNHGRSPHAERFDYPAMVADIDHFMSAHSLDKAAVIGHSMGGKVAMQYALEHPESVTKLVVVDIAPKAYPPNHEPIFEALRAVDFSTVTTRDDVDDQLARRISSKPVRQFLMKNLAYDGGDDGGSYSWQMALESIYANYDRINQGLDNGRSFDGPTLVVRGETSDYVGDADLDDMRRLFPNAREETIEGAGHWVHADAPDAFARVVLDFLIDDQRMTS